MNEQKDIIDEIDEETKPTISDKLMDWIIIVVVLSFTSLLVSMIVLGDYAIFHFIKTGEWIIKP